MRTRRQGVSVVACLCRVNAFARSHRSSQRITHTSRGHIHMPYSVMRFTRAASLAVLLAAGVAACNSDNSTNTVASVATNLAINSGSDTQSGTVGQMLAQPISVLVTDQNGAPFSG